MRAAQRRAGARGAQRLTLACALALSACGATSAPSSQQPVTAAPPSPPDPEPTAAAAAAADAGRHPGPEPTGDDSPEPITGIPSCDRFLAAYRDCEPDLASEIAQGDRRSYRAERAWLEHMKTTSEAPALPGACEANLADLQAACPRAKR